MAKRREPYRSPEDKRLDRLHADREAERDYPLIRYWGRRLGSHGYYIDSQVEQARKDKAPTRSIYRNPDGTWVTADDADVHPDVKRDLDAAWAAAGRGAPLPFGGF